MNANGPITDPDLRALLQAHREDVFAALRCHAIGTIVSFDPAIPSASVRINAQALVYNQPQPLNAGLQTTPQIVDYPVLTDVPVFVPSGGGGRMTFPVAAGDTCLLLFNDRDIDNWFQSGAAMPPNSPRMHSLSDGLAIVGFHGRANPIPDYSVTDLEIILAGGRVAIRSDGSVELSSVLGGTVELTAAGDVNLTSANGSAMTLDAKVLVANASTDLRAVMDLLVTALTTLNGKTGPSAAVQIAAFQTAMQSILRS